MQINIKMKSKNILIFGILVLLVLQVGGVLGEGEDDYSGEVYYGNAPDVEIAEDGTISCTGDADKLIFNKGGDYETIIECSKGIEISPLGKITFIEEGASMSINGNKFENIISAGEKNNAFIEIDKISGKISKCDFWINEEGGEININGFVFEAPTGIKTPVTYNVKGKEILHLEGNVDLDLNTFKRTTIEPVRIKVIDSPIKIEGYGVEIAEGYILNEGIIDFDSKGNVFVSEGNKATINNVEVDLETFGGIKDTNIFFDGEEHEGRHISFGEREVIYSLESSSITYPLLNFKENNPYIKIEKGDHVSLWGSSFVLENRDSKGLVPKITSSKDFLVVQNDGKMIRHLRENLHIEKEFWHQKDYIKTTTSPLEIVVDNPEIEGKIFVDNFNRLAIVPKDIDTEYIAKSEGADVKVSSRIKYNYIDKEDLEKLIGVPIEFKAGKEFAGIKNYEIEEGKKQMALGKLRDYWDGLMPGTKKSIEKIEFASDEYFESKEVSFWNEGFGQEKNIGAFAKTNEATIVFRASNYFDKSTFNHESAHQKHFSLREIDRGKLVKIEKECEKLAKQHVLTTDPKTKKILEKGLENLKQKYSDIVYKEVRFDNEWREISGKSHVAKTKGGYYIYEEDINSESINLNPKYGYTRPYGGSNILEDVATFVEKMNQPEFFKPLLSEDNEWHEIYRGKLDLLYEYKFISESEYNKILEEAGVK